MKFVAHIRNVVAKEPLLYALLLLAFLLRVGGVGYGLPLTVVNDEYPFTYAALQMLQLHTVVPAFHPDAFASILPYPPYLSYLLLAPFALITGVKLLLFQGASALFPAYLISDLSAFFITARLLSVGLGVLSVYLIYRVSESLFRSRIAAAAAGFLLATSLLHEALSMVGRNWMPVSFIFLLALFILTRDMAKDRRYLYAFIVAGIGMGISSISFLVCALIALHYLCFDAKDFKQMMRDAPRLVLGGLVFAVLALVPWLLWHGGNAFLGAVSLFESKSLAGLLASPWAALKLIVYSEPVLVALFVSGLAFIFARYRRTGIFLGAWILLYVGVFYMFFRFDARFLLPLIPLCALAGGYAVAQLWNKRTGVVLCILLSIPLAGAMRLSYLAAQSDTRAHAREWALAHLTPNDRVLVFSSAMRVPTQAGAVAELRSIDAGALRKIDEADESLNRRDVPYALNNLTSLIGNPFMNDLPTYAREHGYTYLILEPRSLVGSATTTEVFATLTKNAAIVARFDGFGSTMSVWESAFTQPFAELFTDKMLGPDILIYRLHE